LQNETLSEPLLNNSKKYKIPHTKKTRNLLVHVVELFKAVVKVDIKCKFRSKSIFTHVEIPRPRDATELNNYGVIMRDICYQTKPILSIFFERGLIKDNSSFTV